MPSAFRINAKRLRRHVEAIKKCNNFKEFKLLQLKHLSELIDVLEKTAEEIEAEAVEILKP